MLANMSRTSRRRSWPNSVTGAQGRCRTGLLPYVTIGRAPPSYRPGRRMSADPRDGRPRGGWHSVPVPRRPLDVPTAAGLALGAVAGLLLGDPRRGHPVAGFGTARAALERGAWRNSRAAGAGYAVALTAAATGIGVATDRG